MDPEKLKITRLRAALLSLIEQCQARADEGTLTPYELMELVNAKLECHRKLEGE